MLHGPARLRSETSGRSLHHETESVKNHCGPGRDVTPAPSFARGTTRTHRDHERISQRAVAITNGLIRVAHRRLGGRAATGPCQTAATVRRLDYGAQCAPGIQL